MEYNFMLKAMGKVLDGMVKPRIPDKAVRRAILAEYKAVIQRASDIGGSNNLLSSYGLAAYFMGLCRKGPLSPEENSDLMEQGMRSSKLFKALMGDAKGYFSEAHMAKRRAWSKETHQRKYPNDWVVDILEKTDDYEFGMDYLECGVCKLCRDEGCPEWAHYLCRLDFAIAEIIGVKLKRTTTLAEGGDKCDFRFSKN